MPSHNINTVGGRAAAAGYRVDRQTPGRRCETCRAFRRPENPRSRWYRCALLSGCVHADGCCDYWRAAAPQPGAADAAK